jgi:hypothetical protein
VTRGLVVLFYDWIENIGHEPRGCGIDHKKALLFNPVDGLSSREFEDRFLANQKSEFKQKIAIKAVQESRACPSIS